MENANVIVDIINPKYGHRPYTVQIQKCGEPGEYIHLTHNFITDKEMTTVFGSRGMQIM